MKGEKRKKPAEPEASGNDNPLGQPESLRELIAKKAYELYAKRGFTPGDQLEDWLEAEKLVMAETGSQGEKKPRAPRGGASRPKPKGQI